MRAKFFIALIISVILGCLVFFWQNNDLEISYHTENEFGPVWVYDSRGVRCMSFLEPPARIVQSCMSLSNHQDVLHSYNKMFLSTLFIVEDPKTILIIGLGGAIAPKALNVLAPNAKIDIVEINPAIPPIVEEYFDYKFNDTNRVFIEDGVEYVKNSAADIYDMVFIDAFSADYIPDGFLTPEFMNHVKRILTKNGVVAMNTLVYGKKEEIESKLFKDTFGEYYNLKKAASRVMIAGYSKLPEYNQIVINSNLWQSKMSQVGVSQPLLLSLYKDTLR